MVTTRRVGVHALLAEVSDAREARALRAIVLEMAGRRDRTASLVVPIDVVPAARTVLIDGLPSEAAAVAWSVALAAVDVSHSPASPSRAPGVTIEVAYDGPDLAEVADAWGCGEAEVIDRHQQASYTVEFCGFAPGFAYCRPDRPLPDVPRRRTPRPRVPAGAVALAGPYCGVYPLAMPGGWQLIGSTETGLFDPARDEPALLSPGTAVRFRALP